MRICSTYCAWNGGTPLALVVSGQTPSVTNWIQYRVMVRGFQSPLWLKRVFSFLLILCACLRRGLIQAWERLPAWYREPPLVWSMEFPHLAAQNEKNPFEEHCELFCSSSSLTCCHVAQPVWLKKLNYKQTNMCKMLLLAFFLSTGAKLSLFFSSPALFFFFGGRGTQSYKTEVS